MRRHLERRTDQVADLASPLDAPDDLDPLLDRVRDAELVLVGEASHGTHEYYRWRAELTKRLITERGFTVVAVEGDWPDCHRIDRAVRGHEDGSIREVLESFERWPTWMSANEEVEEFAVWLRDHNHDRPPAEQVGFYGLDVYSLWVRRCGSPSTSSTSTTARLRARPAARGAGSYTGSVVAARERGRPFEVMRSRMARAGSLEELLHRSAPERSLFVFPDRPVDWLDTRLGHRAIGVVDRPELERAGQYVPTVLARRYDALCYVDTTSALRPVPPEIPQVDRSRRPTRSELGHGRVGQAHGRRGGTAASRGSPRMARPDARHPDRRPRLGPGLDLRARARWRTRHRLRLRRAGPAPLPQRQAAGRHLPGGRGSARRPRGRPRPRRRDRRVRRPTARASPASRRACSSPTGTRLVRATSGCSSTCSTSSISTGARPGSCRCEPASRSSAARSASRTRCGGCATGTRTARRGWRRPAPRAGRG
jgi:hypothetical protein